MTAAYSVDWVSTPPTALPNAPPTGAPAANVENAIERIVEGGNVWARIPSCSKCSIVGTWVAI